MNCYHYGCVRPATLNNVEKWRVTETSTTREVVPTCDQHSLCGACCQPLEVSPITGKIECFVHGERYIECGNCLLMVRPLSNHTC